MSRTPTQATRRATRDERISLQFRRFNYAASRLNPRQIDFADSGRGALAGDENCELHNASDTRKQQRARFRSRIEPLGTAFRLAALFRFSEAAPTKAPRYVHLEHVVRRVPPTRTRAHRTASGRKTASNRLNRAPNSRAHSRRFPWGDVSRERERERERARLSRDNNSRVTWCYLFPATIPPPAGEINVIHRADNARVAKTRMPPSRWLRSLCDRRIVSCRETISHLISSHECLIPVECHRADCARVRSSTAGESSTPS